jgi:DNA (cytosine-5)-methyltransferase 1
MSAGAGLPTLRALDLFCGAGGASQGLADAGFTVFGVDIAAQPRYPFHFTRADVMQLDASSLRGFDLVWASPPCQRYSVISRNMGLASRYPDLIEPVRDLLTRSGVPYVIENVPTAPLIAPVVLCGRMFGLPLIRHRLFEASFPIVAPPHVEHTGDEIPVYGNGTSRWHLNRRGGKGISIHEKRDAMGIDWMARAELAEAIPPAYSKFIAEACLAQERAVLGRSMGAAR